MLFTSLPVLSNGAIDWQLGFQEPGSGHMQNIFDLHNFVLIMMTAITIFVLILLIYVAIRFRKKANPTPSKRTHNALLETLWTAIPVIILIFMAVPSFKLLYEQDVILTPDNLAISSISLSLQDIFPYLILSNILSLNKSVS